MAFPVLSTYRLQTARRLQRIRVHLRRRREPARLPRRPRGLASVPVPDPDRGARDPRHGYDVTDPTTVSAELGGAEGLARLSAAARARGMGLIVDIVPNHVGVDEPAAEPVVVGRAARTAGLRRTRRTSTSTGTSTPTAESCCRCWVPTTTSPTSTVDGDLLRLGDLAFPIAPGTARRHRHRGARPPALQAGRAGATACAATAGSSRSPRWPGCARRTARSSTPPTSRSAGGSPRGWSTASASTTPTGCPTRRLSGVAARTHRPGGLDRDREDPGRRRGAGAHPAGRRHHRLRRAARDRRSVRRPHGRPGADRTGGVRPASTTPRCRTAARPQDPAATDTLASELAPAAPHHRGRHRRRPPTSCPTAVAALLTHIGVYRSRLPRRWPRCCRPRWPKPTPPQPRSGRALQIARGRAGRRAASRRPGCSSSAARSPPSPSRTASSTVTPGWCRSTRWAASRERFGVGAAEFHARAADPGAALAARR